VTSVSVFDFHSRTFHIRFLSNWASWYEFDYWYAEQPDLSGLRGMVPFATADYYARGGGDFYVRDDFADIPRYIAAPFINQVLLNQRVLSIEYLTDQVFVSTNTGVFQADQVSSWACDDVAASARLCT
jgi:hypothetical protein